MKFVAVLLLCCVTVTLQQDGVWSSPYSWLPQYSGLSKSDTYQARHQQPAIPQVRNRQQEAAELLKVLLEQDRRNKEQQVLESSAEGRVNLLPSKNDDKPEDRAFGLSFLGFNALANYVANSLSTTLTTTSTSYTTLTSTITVGTLISCYTRTMFTSTTACRRKRKLLPGLLLGDDHSDHGAIAPSQVDQVEPTDLIPEENKTPFEHSKFLIESSFLEEPAKPATVNRYVRQNPRVLGYAVGEALENLQDETIFITTSTVTSFSLYTSSVTKTITNLAAASVLSCLPACFTLC